MRNESRDLELMVCVEQSNVSPEAGTARMWCVQRDRFGLNKKDAALLASGF